MVINMVAAVFVYRVADVHGESQGVHRESSGVGAWQPRHGKVEEKNTQRWPHSPQGT